MIIIMENIHVLIRGGKIITMWENDNDKGSIDNKKSKMTLTREK